MNKNFSSLCIDMGSKQRITKKTNEFFIILDEFQIDNNDFRCNKIILVWINFTFYIPMNVFVC